MLNKLFQNTCKPKGMGGKFILTMMNSGHAKLSEWAIEHICINDFDSVLDIGCGGGANIARFIKKCPNGFVAGIDYSEESVKFSRKMNEVFLGKNCEIKVGNVSNIEYEDERFDVATAFETVYFWPDLENNFKEVNRVLKPNGHFMICCEESDPQNDKWQKRIEGMRVYSSIELVNLLNKTGFKVETIDEKADSKWMCIVAIKNI